MTFLSNAFSLQMVDLERESTIKITPVGIKDIPLGVISVVGHPDTAEVLSKLMGCNIAYNRVSLKLEKGDVLYVAQVVGGRLPEGCKELPQGIDFKFIKVVIE